MEILLSPGTWSSTLRIATPLILAAMGGLLCEKAGIFNIALEGNMLIGAFAGIVFVHYSGGSVWIGMLGAIVVGMLFSMIFGMAVIKYKANNIIASIAMNMLAVGLTSFLLRTMFKVQGSIRPETINKLSPIKIPLIDKIPFLGEVVSKQSIVTYVSILLVIITYQVLAKTKTGLKISAVGEAEEAAKTAGINPSATRWKVIMVSGMLCGLAGAYLSTTIVSQFSEDMVQGRGFNAFTAVAFASAKPVPAALVCLLFGFLEAVGIRLELMGTGISPSIIKMFPFILALLTLTISSYTTKKRNSANVGV